MTRHCAAAFKECWIRTDDAQVVAAGLESFQPLTLLIDSSDLANANAALKRWQKLGKIQAVLLTSDDTLVDESTGETIGRLCRISNAKDLADVQSAMQKQILDDRQVLLVEASDWTIIPAENLVAASQNRSGKLFGIASDAAAARVLLEALEVGVDGVVLAPSNPAEVRSLATYLDNRARENLGAVEAYQTAKVVEIRPVGMGDRACIDLAESLHPGEGILVGSWAKGLFLVHSECEDSGGWINARPFRVNAGPVSRVVLSL
jgi:3-dehydroquinate synthase class II